MVSGKAGGWRDGSDEEREEVDRALGVKVEKTAKLSAGEEPQWKLWGLRGAEKGRRNEERKEENRKQNKTLKNNQ